MLACRCNHSRIVRMLTDAGAALSGEKNVTRRKQIVAVHLIQAVRLHDTVLLENLLEAATRCDAGAVNLADPDGRTALHAAVVGQDDRVRLISTLQYIVAIWGVCCFLSVFTSSVCSSVVQ
jgi:hypothetical protein